ncbi:MAG TPA: sigma-70 family RNA polymerase sigma factor [Candidatus Sulfotelmatobacter sp.]|nr:sigma-70 family RNA polymerase sigma factor [Candidatus Sulfotelmatobacter sp.]
MNAPDITDTFFRWRNGDPAALQALVPLLYNEVHALAESYLRRERPGHTLQATALAHEAFIRLMSQRQVTWQNRAHFMGLVAQAMRRVLADYARRHRAQKRGGGQAPVALDSGDIADSRDLAADDLDTALEDLAQLEPRQARVVEMRFYGGLSIEETAEVLGTSPATVKRDWAVARAWLHRELRGGEA